MKAGDDAFNRRDRAAMDAAHHPEMIANITGSAEPIMGRDAYTAAMQGMFRAFPDVHVDNDPYPIQFGHGDWMTVVTKARGTSSGEMTLPEGTGSASSSNGAMSIPRCVAIPCSVGPEHGRNHSNIVRASRVARDVEDHELRLFADCPVRKRTALSLSRRERLKLLADAKPALIADHDSMAATLSTGTPPSRQQFPPPPSQGTVIWAQRARDKQGHTVAASGVHHYIVSDLGSPTKPIHIPEIVVRLVQPLATSCHVG